MPTIAEKRAEIEARLAAELALLDAEAKQTELEGLPVDLSDAYARLVQAETIEKRAPHDYEHLIQALIVCVRAVLNDLSKRPPAGKPHTHKALGAPSVLVDSVEENS